MSFLITRSIGQRPVLFDRTNRDDYNRGMLDGVFQQLSAPDKIDRFLNFFGSK
jgi:hypothetical protein